jgi:hypothetical protein
MVLVWPVGQWHGDGGLDHSRGALNVVLDFTFILLESQ